MDLNLDFLSSHERGHRVKHEYHSHVKSTAVKTSQECERQTHFEWVDCGSLLIKVEKTNCITLYNFCPCLQSCAFNGMQFYVKSVRFPGACWNSRMHRRSDLTWTKSNQQTCFCNAYYFRYIYPVLLWHQGDEENTRSWNLWKQNPCFWCECLSVRNIQGVQRAWNQELFEQHWGLWCLNEFWDWPWTKNVQKV